ncbi:MAG: metallophosphoesterase family protein [Bacteroidetes bacterium]|nr:metallophosphoesterase family protein [Bacteroidota bacterium]
MNERLNRFSKFFLSISIICLCCTQAFAQVNLASSYPDRIILNLAQDASTSVAVTWRTSTNILEGYCELQLNSGTRIDPKAGIVFLAETSTIEYSSEDESNIASNQHSYVFTDLIAGKSYLYRVGTEGFWSEWLEFSTPNTDNDEFSFIYFGDPQNDIKSQWSRIIRKAYQYNPNCSFMLYAGDIINNAGSDIQWDEWFKAGSFIYGMVPQFLTPGNHDYDGLTLDPHWNAQFTQPHNGPKGLEGTCFFIDYKNLRVISFDSAVDGELEHEDGYEVTSQKAWLDSVLKNNTKEWVIVTTHLPFYSPKESRDNELIRRNFQPILEKYGVDLVLTGHDHSYGRGTASDNLEMKPSIVYVVSVSGPKLYEAGDKDWMQQKGSMLQLFQNICIKSNVLTYEAFTARGELFDKFILKKRNNSSNKLVDKKPDIN